MQYLASRLCLIIAVCLLPGAVPGQINTFQKIYGGPGNDIAYDLIETGDGFLLAGESGDTATGRSAALLIRTDKNGAVIWQKTYDQFDDGGFRSVLAANDGGFIAWGAVRNFNFNRTDALLVKVDDAGNLVWHKTVGEAGFNESPIGKIIAMPDGYILSGGKTNPGYFQSFVIRVDNAGETLWSRFTPSGTYNAIRASYVSDSLLFLTGTVDGLGCRRTMDPATGAIVQSLEYKVDTTNWLSNMSRSPDGSHVMSGQIAQDIPGLIRINGWLQKIDPNGQVRWSKTYKIGNTNWFDAQLMLPDGSSVVALSYNPFINSSIFYSALIKTDSSGNIVWARDFGGPQSDGRLYKLLHTADGGLIAAGYTGGNSGPGDSDVLLIKMDSLGIVNSCCAVTPAVVVEEVTPTVSQQPFSASNFENTIPLLFATEGTSNLHSIDLCNRTQLVVSQIIVFCPGDSVSIGGILYDQPGTVTATLPSTTGGCDTIAIYTLEYETANQVSTLQLNCPANIITTAPAGANSAVVSYDPPAALSDCSCTDLQINLNSGGASGSLFPTGVNTVCYRAEDACGSITTCCFNITVESDDVCDTKTTGCLEFDLLSVDLDAGLNRVYRIRVTNHCNTGMSYACLQVPDGVQAVAPADNSVFTGSSGNDYVVRSPNFSPFYSVRFKSAAASLANGQSEVLRYVLPAQSAPDYIHAGARLVSGAFYEAHLNTFFCPVGTEADKAADRDTRTAVAELGVYPNPASAGATLSITGGDFPEGIFLLQDPAGKTVLESRVEANRVMSDRSDLPAGLYFFKIFTNGQFAGSGKWVMGN